jgi:hypothetical protein
MGERGHLATTACMAQGFFSKIITPGYSQQDFSKFGQKNEILKSYSLLWITRLGRILVNLLQPRLTGVDE